MCFIKSEREESIQNKETNETHEEIETSETTLAQNPYQIHNLPNVNLLQMAEETFEKKTLISSQ